MVVDAVGRDDVAEGCGTEAALERSRRMEALGRMAAGMAHEFNNLMAVASGSLEMAAGGASGERQARQIARASWAVAEAGRLTRRILDFSGRRDDGAREVDLCGAVAGMESLMAQTAGFGIEVAVEAGDGPVPVVVDVGRMELAVLNLVRNASDAMPGGGRIGIRARRRPGRDGAGQAVLTVSDTGTGMPPEVLLRASEEFFSTKGEGKGTGLGLSMVRGFAEQSGGSMEIESEPGRGTSVSILLPQAAAPPA